MLKEMTPGRCILKKQRRRLLTSLQWDTEWSPSTRPWRQSLINKYHSIFYVESYTQIKFYLKRLFGFLGSSFSSTSVFGWWTLKYYFCHFLPTATLPAYHLSTCVPESLLWWAPCLPTSTLTTPTPPSPPTMFLLRIDLLHQTLE